VKTYHVYILTNRYRTVFYTGVTGDLERRLAEHGRGEGSTFTARYRVHDLVHAEAYPHILDAICREKEIKGWARAKKLALIRAENPHLRTLALR